MRAALLALLLAGCVQSLPVGAERPPRASDLSVIDAVSQAWRAAGNPWTTECRQERRDRIVVVRSANVSIYCASRGPCCGSPEKQHACGCAVDQGASGCAAGATTFEADWVQPLAGAAQHWRVMLWVSRYEDEQMQRRVVAHESIHWLGTCSEVGDDRAHVNAAWWGAQGIESAGW